MLMETEERLPHAAELCDLVYRKPDLFLHPPVTG